MRISGRGCNEHVGRKSAARSRETPVLSPDPFAKRSFPRKRISYAAWRKPGPYRFIESKCCSIQNSSCETLLLSLLKAERKPLQSARAAGASGSHRSEIHSGDFSKPAIPFTNAAGSNSLRTISSGQSLVKATCQLHTNATRFAGSWDFRVEQRCSASCTCRSFSTSIRIRSTGTMRQARRFVLGARYHFVTSDAENLVTNRAETIPSRYVENCWPRSITGL